MLRIRINRKLKYQVLRRLANRIGRRNDVDLQINAKLESIELDQMLHDVTLIGGQLQDSFLVALSEHAHASAEALQLILKYGSVAALVEVALRRNLSPDLIAKIVSKNNEDALSHLVFNPCVEDSVRIQLSKHDNEFVRNSAIRAMQNRSQCRAE